MAKKFRLVTGQSLASWSGDYPTWLAQHPELDFSATTQRSQGSSNDKLTLPGQLFPGFQNPVNLKGKALRAVRYLTFYNPLAAGDTVYPGVARALANTSTATLTVQAWLVPAGGTFDVFDLTRTRTGEVRSVTAVANPGAPGPGYPDPGTSIFTLASAFSTDVVAGEDFTFQYQAVGTSPSVVLNAKFGTFAAKSAPDLPNPSTPNGTIVGLKLTCVSGTPANVNQSRVVTAWDPITRTATLDSAFPTALLVNTDRFVLSPQHTSFEKYALWLPWCPYEGNLTDSRNGVTSAQARSNPYPFGFNYPNHKDTPITYSPEWLYYTYANPAAPPPTINTYPVGSVVSGIVTSGVLGSAYHTTAGLRQYETTGEEAYIIACPFGGAQLAHTEQAIVVADGVGWHDPAQQVCLAPGEPNGCFARILTTLDAAIDAAALDGDTLECVGIDFLHGQTDGTKQNTANAYLRNLRAFKTALRNAIKARGMWPGSAESIPWVQPLVSASWTYYATINAAIQTAKAEDPYMRTVSMDGIPERLDSPGHPTGAGMYTLANRIIEAWHDIRSLNAQAGEVEICNLALSHIGESARVTSISPPDGSVQAALCAQYYSKARDTLLENHAWAGALKRDTLVATTNHSTEWDYAYLRPVEALRVLAVHPANATDDNAAYVLTYPENIVMAIDPIVKTSRPFSEEVAPSGLRVILTDEQDAKIRYIANVVNPANFTNKFKMALSWYLASLLAGPIVKGEAGARLARDCKLRSEEEIGSAQTMDSAQAMNPPNHVPPWLMR